MVSLERNGNDAEIKIPKTIAVLDLQEAYKKQADSVRENFDKFILASRPLAVFLIGCVIGAKTMEEGAFWSFLVPLFILLVFILELSLKCMGCAETK